MTFRPLALILCLAFSSAGATMAAEPWTTYRSNPQRTGNAEGKPGPAAPRILWAMKSKDHFVASPVAWRDRLFVSGLGFINTANFYCLDSAIKPAKRIVWSKGSPFLELPTVSSPAILDGKLIFGDGMHQTNGAYLYCLDLDKGTPLWQLKVEGTLVHLEGSPTISNGKVYLGGGAAGVLCVDPSRVTLDGKEMTLAATAKVIEAKRAELQKKYEEAKKKKDPFAVPPTDKDLPRPSPTLVWQQGKEKWHVDAPVAVVDGKVLVASAYLDKEKVGRRALFCLDAKTGRELWNAPLAINPWGGPSVQDKLVLVSGSTVGYDPAALKGAKGIIAAFDLDSGKPRWKKELAGGAVACVALSKDLAVVTCTDGKVRAYTLARGAPRWAYDAGAALFAPVALSADTAYAADLKGVVHAINLKTGGGKWKLDLATDADVMAPGMVYAGPTLNAGRLYVATCNIAGDHVNKPTAVVCIGDKPTAERRPRRSSERSERRTLRAGAERTTRRE
jgi:outer membrane protein assembly factor BamB